MIHDPDSLPIYPLYDMKFYQRINGLLWHGSNNKHQTIKNLLSALKGPRSHVRTVFTDQCCIDRKMLQTIFGRDVMVYLDTFHFKQRLRRALPKHPQKLFVSGQLKSFLTGDRHWTREEILEALDVWHNLAIQEGLGTRTLAQAVGNAKGHVRKGCLDENKVGTQLKPVRTPVAILGSLGVCIYVPASRHWLISYSPIHLN